MIENFDETIITEPCVLVKFMEDGLAGVNKLHKIMPCDDLLKFPGLIAVKNALLDYTTEKGQPKICTYFDSESKSCINDDKEDGHFLLCKAMQGIIYYKEQNSK